MTGVVPFDSVLLTGVDTSGLFHDQLVCTVSTVSHDAIKVWPHDLSVGSDDSGKIWFWNDAIRELIVYDPEDR